MDQTDIARLRMYSQQISHPGFKKPEEVVARLGAMQAQDFLGSLWAVGLRSGCPETEVEKAIAERKIVRTWPMRGTLHYVVPEDVRWMQKLLAPRIITKSASRYRELELDEAVLQKSGKIISEALKGGKQLSRDELYKALEKHGISAANQRGIHILGHLAQNSLICIGPRSGKTQTFVLLDEWIPKTKEFSTEEVLEKLAVRYTEGHGPVTIADLVWWSGAKVSEVRQAFELAGSKLDRHIVGGTTYWAAKNLTLPSSPGPEVHLLPSFDEYIVGYKDREPMLMTTPIEKIVPGRNGMFFPIVVVNGVVKGIWKRTIKSKNIDITVTAFGGFNKKHQGLIAEAAEQYARFLDKPLGDVIFQ